MSSSSSSSSISSSPSYSSPSPPFTPPSSPTQPSPPPTGDASLATSASLYLYTFLATLVLLLVVSAAIVVRSLMLRRRHRIMIEEAIRNGTLPPPFAYQRPRVDLSKKPKMWNAWIEATAEHSKTGGRSREKEWYWDMMKPFSAISIASPSSPAGGSGGGVGGNDHQTQNIRASTSAFMDRLRQFGNIVHGPRLSTNSVNDSTNLSTTQLASASTALSNLDSGSVSLKVAVLIALPRKPSSSSYNKASQAAQSPSSPLSSPAPASPSRPISLSGTIIEQVDDDEPLPCLEIGVTEIRVVPNVDDADTDQEKRSIAG